MNRIGFLVPSTNLTVEYEIQYLYFHKYFDIDKLSIYTEKLESSISYTENKLRFLENIYLDAFEKKKHLDKLGVSKSYFLCTSASCLHFNEMENILSASECLTMYAKRRKIKKCLLITPYNQLIAENVIRIFEKSGINVKRNLNLDLCNSAHYFEFGKNKLSQYIEENYKTTDGDIIISCTNLPTIHFINTLEKKIKAKIISSNSSIYGIIKQSII